MAEGNGFQEEMAAINRYYTERFLPASPWASLLNGHP